MLADSRGLHEASKRGALSAVNELEAIKIHQADPGIIHVIFMRMLYMMIIATLAPADTGYADVAVLIKDVIEATLEIRTFEATHNLPRVRIEAVACFSTTGYQRDAFAASVDFLIKPVPMKALKPILKMDTKLLARLEDENVLSGWGQCRVLEYCLISFIREQELRWQAQFR